MSALADPTPVPDPTRSPGEPSPASPPAAVGAYLEALRDVQGRERDVLRVVRTIQEAARSLACWQAVYVAHSGAGFPKEVTMMGRAIDASTWPGAQELADVLAAWHSSAESARVAWHHIPCAERSSLPPPP